MQTVTRRQLEEEESYILFIYTPLCGTCTVGRSMLEKIEAIHGQDIFYEMNANFAEPFLHEHKIESVPCLLIKEGQKIKEKVYTFYSIGNIYQYLYKYKKDLFKHD